MSSSASEKEQEEQEEEEEDEDRERRKEKTRRTKGQLGALNAESYVERVNSMGKLVLTDGNTLLSDDEIQMLVTLRMNKAFMEFMRAHYNGLVINLQQHGITVVDPDAAETVVDLSSTS